MSNNETENLIATTIFGLSLLGAFGGVPFATFMGWF